MTVKIDGSNGLLQNYDYQVPTTGFSYTFTTYNVWFGNPAGTLATGTITMPASPVDGMTTTITTTQQITALTINANTGQSIVGGGAVQFNANTSRQYMYRLANTTWYLINVAAGNITQSFAGGSGQVFTSSGTFTVPTGVSAVKVTCIGGGGNGGNATVSSNYAAGGGGGGGGTAIKYVTGLTAGGTVTVTVGAVAGTSSFGAYCSATGGASAANASASATVGGAGGTGSSGDLNITGSTGANGFRFASSCCGNNAVGANGGAAGGALPSQPFWPPGQSTSLSFIGGAAAGLIGGGGFGATAVGNGGAATGYGNGGGGACRVSTTGTSTGGAGTGGIVIVEW
jgi:hypothetical protein